MFLGADKFRHQEYGNIKKCSKCHDTNLRFLGQAGGGGPFPIWMCGNGHIVFPYYDDDYPNRAYLLLEGNPMYGNDFEIEQGSKGISNCGCCDGGTSYGCNLPNQITIDMSGILGTRGTRKLVRPVTFDYFYPYAVDNETWALREDPIPDNWQAQSWSVSCGGLTAQGECHSTYIPPGCFDPSCYDYCTGSYSLDGDFVTRLNDTLSKPLKFWGVSPYDASFIKRSVCDNYTFPNCNYVLGDPYDQACEEPLDLPMCHECGTLKCSDENSTYRIPCSVPDDIFTVSLSTRDIPNTGISYQDVAGRAHTIEFLGDGPASICGIKNFYINILPEDTAGLPESAKNPDGSITLSADTLFDIRDKVNYNAEEPDCLRRSIYDSIDDVHVADIVDQTIILDRVNYNTSIIWDESERRAKPNEPDQAFIESPLISASGSDVEPELIALIISESGTGGQIAFQTYPVTFDTDEFVEDTAPGLPGVCKSKARVKAFGYGVMYPFIDDPIWRTENTALEGSDLSGGPAYNWPVFLPGKKYKVGDKIEFRFWQTLDSPPQPDPSAGEVYRTVILATATIKEVDNNGGILWYEFDGDPISGDCPCTKDKYCGGLSRLCYPESHPNTEEGIEGYCPRGETCEQLVVEECNLPLSVFIGSNCYPLSSSWDIGGYYGRSSCSGLAEPGTQASWDGEYYIPGKAPRYYYAWLPDPDCFFAYDNDFLEYMAFDEYFSFNGPFFNQDRDDFPGCSPLYKIYRNATTDNLNIKTRFKDYSIMGPPCRKTYLASDANTLFVAYEGGDGSISNPTNSTRLNDDYCRVYGFYQQKQYDCGVTYEGQYILRSQNIGEGNLTCEPIIGTVTIKYLRQEVKNDITISAPVNQDYLLPEFLPTPVDGLASSTWPFQQGQLQHWLLKNAFDNIPDPRGNCVVSAKVYYEQNGKIEYDCDNFWTTEDNGQTWDANDYKEYYDGFNDRMAWRNTFVPVCGYPWDFECQKKGTNADFADPTPSCYIDDNQELICEGIDEAGNFTDPEQDPCNPYCMLSNSSASIAIEEITTSSGCPNGTLITDDNRYFESFCFFQTNFTCAIELPWTRSSNCQDYTNNISGNKDHIIFFAYGDPYLVTPQIVESKVQEYLDFWQQRYQSIGVNLQGFDALLGNNFGAPYDRDYVSFFNKIFEINGLARIHILLSMCYMAELQPPDGISCKSRDEFLNELPLEGINTVHEYAGKISKVSILNPGGGYAFEVEERYSPTGVVQPKDIVLEVNSVAKSKRRKSETWSLEDYTLTHNGTGYNVGDTIPITFNDTDAIREGVQYKSIPTLEITEVNEGGTITNSSILNSGEYYKWIKTGEHRAYPITIVLSNYWEGPGHKENIIGIGKHADLRAVVGVDPTKDTYGKIVDIIIDESGLEYLPTGKYWTISTNFSNLGLDHLVDPCKYDLLAKDDNQETHFINNNVGLDYYWLPPQGYKHVLPPLTMNNGEIIKWSDRVLSWTTVIATGNCPNELMNKTYKMALSENINLMQADCSAGACQDVISTRIWTNSEGQNPEWSGRYICNRWTGFYAHAHKGETGNNGSYDDLWRVYLLLGQNNIIAPDRSADIQWYGDNDIEGCYGELKPHDGLNSPIAFFYNGNQNPSDPCNGAGTEYSIVGNWSPRPFQRADIRVSAHTHRIYKMAGQDITMTIKSVEEQ